MKETFLSIARAQIIGSNAYGIGYAKQHRHCKRCCYRERKTRYQITSMSTHMCKREGLQLQFSPDSSPKTLQSHSSIQQLITPAAAAFPWCQIVPDRTLLNGRERCFWATLAPRNACF